MASCELCGRESRLSDVIVEGSILAVCENCARFGNVVRIPPNNAAKNRPDKKKPENIIKKQEIETVVGNYNILIRKARESKGLTQELLGKYLAEKESVIHKLESAQIRPSIQLAKKLSQFLGVDLLTKEVEEKYERPLDINENGLTIGDLIKFRKAKKKEEDEPPLV